MAFLMPGAGHAKQSRHLALVLLGEEAHSGLTLFVLHASKLFRQRDSDTWKIIVPTHHSTYLPRPVFLCSLSVHPEIPCSPTYSQHEMFSHAILCPPRNLTGLSHTHIPTASTTTKQMTMTEMSAALLMFWDREDRSELSVLTLELTVVAMAVGSACPHCKPDASLYIHI